MLPIKKKDGRGGVRKGAGRKSRAEETSLKETILEALGTEGILPIWKKVIEQAKEGSDKHQAIILNYFHGKPKETKEIEVTGDLTIFPPGFDH